MKFITNISYHKIFNTDCILYP